LIAGLILIGVGMITAGVVFRPSIVAEHISPDGVFADGALDKLTILKICRWATLIIGALLLCCGILKLVRRNSAGRIEHAVEEITVRPFKQPRIIINIIFTLLALVLLNKTINFALGEKWKSVIGYEYYWIAESLVGGHGYGIAANHRWYFHDFQSEYPADQYYPTALEEPVFPFLLAFAFKSFGEYGRLAVLLFNVVALYFTALVIYLLVRKIFDSHLGVIASIALLTWWWFDISWLTLGVFSPAILGGLIITFSAYLLLWSLEKVSVKRGVLLGLMLGFSCLTLAAGMFFIPVAALLTLILKRPVKPLAWGPALAIVVTACVVLSPWTLRNYLVFGKFIPIRTGSGVSLHQSNPSLAATFSTGSYGCVKELGPTWHAKDAKDAIEQARSDTAKRFAMYKRSYDCIKLGAPDHFSEFNEGQRDSLYVQKSMEFIIANPKIFLELTRYRIQAFLVGWSPRHTLVTLLAMVGALMGWRNKKAVIMVVLVATYAFPFSIAASLMYRYRYPIEPIMFVLASGIPIIILSKVNSFICKIKSPVISQTT
jgi:4-amino-4-deoxy-L-arabinose transferase-like glycosyltransferase